ncbi:MAG: hypothetical protein J1G02_06595 [Clostridiales bacterium]|nr:hypothetical protein [Clostridiales bacterium]
MANIKTTQMGVKLGKSRLVNFKNLNADISNLFSNDDALNDDIQTREPKFDKNSAFNKSFSTANPVMDGVASRGSTDTVARGDHRHPTDTTRLAVAPNGIDTLLDSNYKISEKYLPDTILGQLEYQGVFDPIRTTNQLVRNPARKGDYYIANNDGGFNPDGTICSPKYGNDGSYQVGDWAVFNGESWDKIDNTDAVTMVNHQKGNVETYKGDWVSTKQYYKGDFVKRNGVLYIAEQNSKGQDPATSPEYWTMLGAVFSVNKETGDVQTHKGTWSSGNTYHAGTTVSDSSGDVYLAVKDVPANTELSNSTYWVKISYRLRAKFRAIPTSGWTENVPNTGTKYAFKIPASAIVQRVYCLVNDAQLLEVDVALYRDSEKSTDQYILSDEAFKGMMYVIEGD